MSQGFVYFNHEDPERIIESVVLSGDEADFRNAVQALAPLLSDADRAKYRDMIEPSMPKQLVRKYREWRARNAR